ncbi:MAG: BlaI/MecI/CopY family transcriptional regulator [Desulfobacteraceae bacterium]|jgi:predicted transcriptional regulator
MPKEKDCEIRLGRLEMQIMNVVWEKGKATVHEVKEALGKGRKPAYSTILTMMRKIEAKGYLEHDVDDRTYVYRPTISQDTARRSILGDIMDRLFAGSPTLLLNSLVEQNQVNDKELAQLKKLINEAAENE